MFIISSSNLNIFAVSIFIVNNHGQNDKLIIKVLTSPNPRYKLNMKRLKTLLFAVLLIYSCGKGFAQNTVPVDSAKIIRQKTGSSVRENNNNSENEADKIQGNSQNAGGAGSVKSVKGARPDMSRSRGARPAYIERQPGSSIPKGLGKPGGAIRPGKR
jgi:hypothetical protein